MDEFRYRLIELRNNKRLTQGKLAKELNMTRSAISLYELGLKKPDYETLEKIADYFRVTIDYLLGRAPLKHVREVYRDENSVSREADPRSNIIHDNKDDDAPTPEELEKFIKDANIMSDGAPLTDQDKEDVIDFIKIALRAIKKRKRERGEL